MTVIDRHETERDIEETFGLVPEFFRRVPDYLLLSEWASFKVVGAFGSDRDSQQVQGVDRPAVSGATRCRYCCYFHTARRRGCLALLRTRSPRPR